MTLHSTPRYIIHAITISNNAPQHFTLHHYTLQHTLRQSTTHPTSTTHTNFELQGCTKQLQACVLLEINPTEYPNTTVTTTTASTIIHPIIRSPGTPHHSAIYTAPTPRHTRTLHKIALSPLPRHTTP